MNVGDISTLKGKVPMGVTAGMLRLLKDGNVVQFEALAELCGKDEGFDDRALLLDARKRLQKVLEFEKRPGGMSFVEIEEEVLDGVMVLGDVCMWMDEYDECDLCFERAKEGFACLL